MKIKDREPRDPHQQVLEFLRLKDTSEPRPDWVLRIFSGITPEYQAFKKAFIEYCDSSRFKSYLYMVTFTIDKKKFKGIDDEVEAFIRRQATRKPLKITRFLLVKEYCKSGVAHWHALIKTIIPLKKDRFNYYISKFGRIDISKSKTNDEDEIINYMSKSGTIECLRGEKP